MEQDKGHQLAVFLHLAKASQRKGRLLVRDRFLILSAALAGELGFPNVAAHCRQLVLEHNPNHLIGKVEQLQPAEADEDFSALLRQLRRRYPIERAERLLDSMGIELARERETYFSDQEYAAALLGTSPGKLGERYG